MINKCNIWRHFQLCWIISMSKQILYERQICIKFFPDCAFNFFNEKKTEKLGSVATPISLWTWFNPLKGVFLTCPNKTREKGLTQFPTSSKATDTWPTTKTKHSKNNRQKQNTPTRRIFNSNKIGGKFPANGWIRRS